MEREFAMTRPFRFRWDATRFDMQNAWAMARVAKVVYREVDEIESFLCDEWGFLDFDFIDVEDTQCVVASNEQMTPVGFRGTEPDSLADWITDAKVELVAGPLGGEVHVGFYEALSGVWQQVDRRVLQFDPQGRKPLWVTGHSLGGGLATLAVARWLEAGQAVSGVYTFGQPRTGDRTFARNFNFEFKPYAFRFVNNNDLVTRAPPRAFGYSHVGTFRYFDADGNFEEGLEWWNLFLDGWKGRLDRIFLNDGITDHSMRCYLERIAATLPFAETETSPLTFRISDIDPRASQLTHPRRRAA